MSDLERTRIVRADGMTPTERLRNRTPEQRLHDVRDVLAARRAADVRRNGFRLPLSATEADDLLAALNAVLPANTVRTPRKET